MGTKCKFEWKLLQNLEIEDCPKHIHHILIINQS
jgi:hypothetical protein